MTRKSLTILGGCIIGTFIVMITLYATSPIGKETYRGPFARNFSPNLSLKKVASVNLGFNSYYIAGMANTTIYFANYTSPFHMISFRVHQGDTQRIWVKPLGIDSLLSPKAFKTVVDSPSFTLMHGTMPLILRGKVGDWRAWRFTDEDKQPFFVEGVPTDSSSVLLRYFNTERKQYELGRQTLDSPYFDSQPRLLKKQIDGLFCVEGVLSYDKSTNQVVYVYSYRNQFTITDSKLNQKYIGHTIDTFSHALIKVATIEKDNDNMLAAPPIQTNLRSRVSMNHLYVHSNVMAKNEDVENFMNNDMIDVYDLTNGAYLYSFYVPNQNHHKLSDFSVQENWLVAIFDEKAIVFDLSLSNNI